MSEKITTENILSLYDENESLSLYLHIPFCFSKCAYCAFYSIPKSKTTDEMRKAYFTRLIEEATLVREYINKPFETIYIGGGTPLLEENVEYIRELLKSIDSKKCKEVTVECNAENYTQRVSGALGEYITRISVGIQTFDREKLSFLSRRRAEEEHILRILDIARDKKINFDFIMAIPQNTERRSEEDFETLFNLVDKKGLKRPEHLSAYLLTIEEGTALERRIRRQINNCSNKKDNKRYFGQSGEWEAKELEKAWDFLKKEGYLHYEVSAFARNEIGVNNKCYHNLRYWNLENYLGLGTLSGSHSKKGYDITGPALVEEYNKGKAFSGYEVERLSSGDIAEELLLTHLRTTDGISVEKFNSLAGLDLQKIVERADSKRENKPYSFISHLKDGKFSLSDEELILSDFYIRELALLC